jgi:hypothetical protein
MIYSSRSRLEEKPKKRYGAWVGKFSVKISDGSITSVLPV